MADPDVELRGGGGGVGGGGGELDVVALLAFLLPKIKGGRPLPSTTGLESRLKFSC